MNTSDEKLQRRAVKRFPANVMVRFYYRGGINFGKVTNFSENGMFVSTKMVTVNINSQFQIIIPVKHEDITVPVQVRRLTMTDNFYNGFGVELVSLSGDYSKFVNSLKPSS